VQADFYHAGLNPEIRTDKQEAWMKNQIRIMVSTNAFGMGIDKPDVRSVIHLELPDSLEAYFQEAGRAGRDEQKAYCVLLYDELDGERLRRNFETAFPPMKVIRQVYRALGSYFQLAVGAGIGRSFDFDIGVFLQRYNLKALQTYNSLKILSQAGWLVMSETIFSPATIKIKVNREVLYDYQLKQLIIMRLFKKVKLLKRLVLPEGI